MTNSTIPASEYMITASVRVLNLRRGRFVRAHNLNEPQRLALSPPLPFSLPLSLSLSPSILPLSPLSLCLSRSYSEGCANSTVPASEYMITASIRVLNLKSHARQMH